MKSFLYIYFLLVLLQENMAQSAWNPFLGKKIETISEANQQTSGGRTTVGGLPAQVRSNHTTQRTTRETVISSGKKKEEYTLTCRIARIEIKSDSPTLPGYDSENTFERNPALSGYYERMDRFVDKRISRIISDSGADAQEPNKEFMRQWHQALPPTHKEPELWGIFLTSRLLTGVKAGQTVSDTLRNKSDLWVTTYRFSPGTAGRWLVQATFVRTSQASSKPNQKLPAGAVNSTSTDGDFSGELEVDAVTGFIYQAKLTRSTSYTTALQGSSVPNSATSTYNVRSRVLK